MAKINQLTRMSHSRRLNSLRNNPRGQAMRNAARLMIMAYRRRNQIRRLYNAATYLRSLRGRSFKINTRTRTRTRNRRGKMVKISGMANGPTYTTTRMIVRSTPPKQKFLRKLFKTNPVKQMYVNRFGYAWMGATDPNKTVWYSSTALKFNNLLTFMNKRVIGIGQVVGAESGSNNSTNVVGNLPESYIYLGKCTYSYEIYNPTNYNVTVWIYDLICKRDTPYGITYADATNTASSAPENMMYKSTHENYSSLNPVNGQWTIADPETVRDPENHPCYWNTIGMKPTDYHYFNTFWKVKGMKKIVLAPTSGHHHIVVFNPKAKLTQASLLMPRQNINLNANNGLAGKIGIAGLTISTLFGFQGQVAVENDVVNDNSADKVGTLPGKLIITHVKKENVYSGQMNAAEIIQDTNLLNAWNSPKIFTDLQETNAMAV